ncbi:MAG: TIM barrel protein [Candidatus Woesearchaeota archaeon]
MKKINGLLFGTAGIPLSTVKPNTINGIIQVKELGLDAMELEFVHSVFLKESSAMEAGLVADNNDIVLTAHAPYYVNLNAVEQEKIEASKHRILQSARMLNHARGYSVVYHPGYYFKDDHTRVYDKIRKSIVDMERIANDESLDVWIRPETTGKQSQFGTLKELLDISQGLEKIMPCIDFAHLHARSNGAYNTIEEFRKVFGMVEESLGKRGLENMHVHYSGIEYTAKGEKNHLVLEESDFAYKDWVGVLKEYNISGVFISESPNIEGDAVMIKKLYSKIK